jgi:hypothetical protein
VPNRSSGKAGKVSTHGRNQAAVEIDFHAARTKAAGESETRFVSVNLATGVTVELDVALRQPPREDFPPDV